MADNIDKFFKDNLGDDQVPFDPSLWEEAAARLDQKEKRKRILWWYIPIGALVAIMVVLGLYFQHENQSQNSSPEGGEIAGSTTINEDEDQGINSKNFSQESTLNSTSEPKPPMNTSTQKYQLSAEAASLKNNSQNENQSQSSPDVSPTGAAVAIDYSKPTDNTNKEATDNSNSIYERPSQTNIIKGLSNVKLLDSRNRNMQTLGLIDMLPAASLEKQLPEKSPMPSEISIRIPGERAWHFGLETGVDAFTSEGGNVLFGANLGVWSGFDFSLDWAVRAGLHYQYLNGEVGTPETTSQVQYGFGSTYTQQELSATGAHFLSLPIWVHRNIRDHQLQLGLKPMYLLQVSAKKETSNFPNGGSLARTESQTGVLPGVENTNRMHLGLMLRYAYPVQNFLVGVSGQYFTKPLIDMDENGAGTYSPYALGLFVQYSLK